MHLYVEPPILYCENEYYKCVKYYLENIQFHFIITLHYLSLRCIIYILTI